MGLLSRSRRTVSLAPCGRPGALFLTGTTSFLPSRVWRVEASAATSPSVHMGRVVLPQERRFQMSRMVRSQMFNSSAIWWQNSVAGTKVWSSSDRAGRKAKICKTISGVSLAYRFEAFGLRLFLSEVVGDFIVCLLSTLNGE
eukprot:233117-Rhodomonas_salina.1